MAAPITPEPIGPPWSSALWFPLGDGEPSELWRRFQGLMVHLSPKTT
ncbi:DUF6177 family protein [Nocardiopsis alkaliphila]